MKLTLEMINDKLRYIEVISYRHKVILVYSHHSEILGFWLITSGSCHEKISNNSVVREWVTGDRRQACAAYNRAVKKLKKDLKL